MIRGVWQGSNTLQTFDLVISGAGISGLVAGVRAQELGLRTLIVEKQKKFVETLRGEYIQPAGLKTFRALGLLPKIAKAGVEVHHIDYHHGSLHFLKRPRYLDFSYANDLGFPEFAVAIPHLVLKNILLQKYKSLGGELWMNSLVEGHEEHKEQNGIGARLTIRRENEVLQLKTKHLAISEGHLSSFAKKLSIAWTDHSTATSFMVGGISRGDRIPEGRFITAPSREGLVCAFKVSSQETRVYFYKDNVKNNPFKTRRPEHFLKAACRSSTIATLFEGAQFHDKVMTAPYIPRYCETPSMGFITLIGDAAGPSHPLGGMGMSTAARDGIELSELLYAQKQKIISPGVLNNAFNASRSQRYLNSKFISEILSYIMGSTSLKGRAFRKYALHAWKESEDAKQFCGMLFGGMITGPLTGKDIFRIWGFQKELVTLPWHKNVPQFYYASGRLSPGKLLSEIIR